MGVQQRPGVRGSPELGAQAAALRWQVQITLTRSKAASASSLLTRHACLYHRDEVYGGKSLHPSTQNTHCFVLSQEKHPCLPAAQSQEGFLVLSMCGPKKQAQTSGPDLKLMSSLPAPGLWLQRAPGQGNIAYSTAHR